jgi:predicted nucleic acid-binding protein
MLLDAGIWAAATNPRERFHQASDALVESTGLLAALDLTLFEVANTVGAKWRQRERAEWALATIVARCQKRLVRVDMNLAFDAIAIAEEQGLTAYDAAYVAVAQRNGWTLVSTDIADLVSKGLAVTPDAAV